MTDIIYDNGHTVIRTTRHYDRRSCLVLSFSSFGDNDPFSEGFGQRFLERNGCAVISVKKRADNWYRDLPFDELVDVLSPFRQQYDRLFTYGASMGAYAALYFASSIGATPIAISPRNSVDPRFVTPTYAVYARRWPVGHGTLQSVADPALRPYIVYDPLIRSDKTYIEEEVRPAFPLGHYVTFPFSGHPSAEAMLNIGQLKSFVLAALAGDVPSARINSAGVKRNSAIILNEMSKWASGSKRPLLARSLSDAAIEKGGERKELLFQRGSLLIAAGAIDEAAELTERTISISAPSASLYHRLATLRARLQQPDAALEAANAGLDHSPSNVSLLRTRRNLLEAAGETKRAVIDGQAVIALLPDNASDRMKLAGLLIADGDHDAALPHLDAVLATSRDLSALRRRRICLEALGRNLDAVAAAEAVVQEASDTLSDIIRLAHLQALVGEFEIAASWMEKAIALSDGNVSLYRRKRDYLEQSGRIDEARKTALIVHRLAPNNKTDKARLRRLNRLNYGRIVRYTGRRGLSGFKSGAVRISKAAGRLVGITSR